MENKIESQEHLNIFLQAEEKCFTHLLYSFLSLLLDLYELKAEPMFSFCWVISEQSLRALKYKSLWTVFSCEWISQIVT